jgi:thiamine-phosphate pyrophosphorylase
VSPPAAAPGPRCQPLLISPPQLEPGAFAPLLEAALATGGSAGFLLRLEPAEGPAVSAAAARLRPLCAARQVAFLLQDDVELARELGADGVHLASAEEVPGARRALGPDAIIGAASRDSRHVAMVAGDAGADYIAFGAAGRPPDEALGELAQWWSELFVLPCLVEGDLTLAECVELARRGADLLGVQALIWQHPAGPARALAELRGALAAG